MSPTQSLLRPNGFGSPIELLAQEDIKISDVAAELGYTKPGNFTRAFLTWTGLTPSKFRTRHLGPQPAGRPAEKTMSDSEPV